MPGKSAKNAAAPPPPVDVEEETLDPALFPGVAPLREQFLLACTLGTAISREWVGDVLEDDDKICETARTPVLPLGRPLLRPATHCRRGT